MVDSNKKYEYVEAIKNGEKNMCDVDLRGVDFRDVDLRGVKLSGANLRHANLSNTDLRNTDLRNTDLSYVYLVDVNLHGANLNNTELAYATLQGANLRGATLQNTNLSGANLIDAKLHNVNLHYTNLHGANLGGADLGEVSLYKTDLSNANLCSTDLSYAYLNDVNLHHANLKNAILHNTKFNDCILTNANLSGVRYSPFFNQYDWMEENFERDRTGFYVYKRITHPYFHFSQTEYHIPDRWIIKEGSYITEEVNMNRSSGCGHGVNFATENWCRHIYTQADLWICKLHDRDLPELCIPLDTDGKARCGKLQLIRKVDNGIIIRQRKYL